MKKLREFLLYILALPMLIIGVIIMAFAGGSAASGLKKLQKQFKKEHGREPTFQELANMVYELDKKEAKK